MAPSGDPAFLSTAVNPALGTNTSNPVFRTSYVDPAFAADTSYLGYSPSQDNQTHIPAATASAFGSASINHGFAPSPDDPSSNNPAFRAATAPLEDGVNGVVVTPIYGWAPNDEQESRPPSYLDATGHRR